ncbi:MAG TPA: hypothetical protein VI357_08425 [Mycobacteriales bacterium]
MDREVSAVTHVTPDQRTITVGQLRALLETLPRETPLLVGIRDRHHFNTLLGDLAVTGAAILPSGSGRALTLDVEKLS